MDKIDKVIKNIVGVKFSKKEIRDYEIYEEVRVEGRFNMFSAEARMLTGLSRGDYQFVMRNYSDLKKQANN